MANFFKDYQGQIKKDKELKEKAEQTEKQKYIFKVGQVVKINPIYDHMDNNGKKYFADYLSEGYILLADTKSEAKKGIGKIYSKAVIL